MGTFTAVRACAVIGSLLAGAAAAQETRSFQAIQVEGNARFTAGEIIETSGLATGTLMSEDDIIAAVEALDYTGEFRDVRIFSRGEVLIIAVEEEPPYAGTLVFGLGYNTDEGVVGSGTVNVADVFRPGMTLSGGFDVSEEVQTLSAELSSQSFWGAERAGGVQAAFENYDYDSTTYDYRTALVSPFRSYKLDDRTWVELRYALSTGDVRNVESNASPIIQAEEGQLVSSGVGFSFLMGNVLAESSTEPRQWMVRLDQDLTGLGGDTDYSRTELSLFGRAALGQSGLAIRSRVEMGSVVAFAGGDEPRAPDRFALGGASLRGFEFGTVNPRDVCLDCRSDGGNIITNLGGNYYAVARTDLLMPSIPRLSGLETFIFGDVGSAWDVRTDVAPAGVLEDALDWRSSAGVGVSWRTALGDFEGYYSLVENGQRYDEIQEFGLTFRTRF